MFVALVFKRVFGLVASGDFRLSPPGFILLLIEDPSSPKTEMSFVPFGVSVAIAFFYRVG